MNYNKSSLTLNIKNSQSKPIHNIYQKQILLPIIHNINKRKSGSNAEK